MATAAAYIPDDSRSNVLPMRRLTPPPKPAGAGEVTPRDVFNALRYHLVLFLTLGTLAALAGAAAGWTLFPARYQTYAMLRVASSDPTLMDTGNNGVTKTEFGTYLSTQAGLIKSHMIINRALRKPEIINLPMLQGLDAPIAFLEEKVVIEFSERSELMKVLMAGEDPQQITKIVNAVADAFISEVETYKQNKQYQYDKLLRAKADQEKALEELQRSYQAQFRKDSGNEAALKNRQRRIARLMQVQSDETRVRNDLQKVREQLDFVQARIKSAESTEASPGADLGDLADGDAAVVKKAEEVTRIENYISLKKRTTTNPNSPHIRDYETRLVRERSELEETKRQARERLRKLQVAKSTTDNGGVDVVTKLQAEIVRLTTEERQVKAELAELSTLFQEEPASGPPPEQKLADIKIQTAQDLVAKLEHQTRLKKAELEADDRVKLIEKASVPQNREMKKQIAFTGLGAVVGLGLVGGLISIGEIRRKRVYSSTDPIFTSLPLLGRIPEHGFVSPKHGAEPAEDDACGLAFREAVDRVKTLVLRQMARKGLKSLLVTSPATDEGKSILAWNLAAGFARTDYRVLFIDANLHAPSIHRHLEIAPPEGFAEVLRGERTLNEMVLRTPVENLCCLPAGHPDGQAHQALDKTSVQRVLDRAKKDYDLIVIDSSALCESVDPLYLAQRVDACVVSLRTFRSRVKPVEQACRRLELLGTPILGAVLTDPTLTDADL